MQRIYGMVPQVPAQYEPGHPYPAQGHPYAVPRQPEPPEDRWPPQPPTRNQGPPPQPPRPRRPLLLTGLGATFALIIVATLVSAADKPSRTPTVASTPPASAKAAQDVARQTVTYKVTGTRLAEVTYGPAGSNLTGHVPMSITATLGDAQYYALQAQLQGYGSVSVTISVNGKVISRGTASGGYNVASAEISQDPLTGAWEDMNQSLQPREWPIHTVVAATMGHSRC